MATSSLNAQCTPAWDGTFGVPGPNGPVFAVETFNDGSGEALYVGGSFTSVGGVSITSNLAKWDGTTWTAVGNGVIDFGAVRALQVHDDGSGARLFVGGQFFGTGGFLIALVTAFDGTTWDDLSGGMEGPIVSAFEVFDPGTGPQLYAGGNFISAGGNSADGIASWNGTTWSALGSGITGDVNTLATHDDGSGTALYVGGFFFTAGGVGVQHVAEWNGSVFSSLGGGLNNAVWALESFAGGLVVGGDFFPTPAGTADHIATWDGIGFIDIGGANLNPWTMSVVNIDGTDQLVVGGAFTTIGGVAASHIATWDGLSFAALDGGADSDVRALAVHSAPGALTSGLYVGGLFGTVDGSPAVGIARYDTCASTGSGPLFQRGDINSDGGVDIADAVTALDLLFVAGTTVNCEESADVNDDGQVNIADPIYLLGYLFTPPSPAPPHPFGVCDQDTDGDPVPCATTSPGC
jgi:hypothetical protein